MEQTNQVNMTTSLHPHEIAATSYETLLANSELRAELRAQLDDILSTNVVDWDAVKQLLLRLQATIVRHTSPAEQYASLDDDPMGRLLLTRIISKEAPAALVAAVLGIFPYALDQNPACFLAAAQTSSLCLLKRLAGHVSGREQQCPFPWILSESISVETVQKILEAFPEGVLLPSPYLSYENPLDYLLFSKSYTDRRTFDESLWNKLKMMLVVAGSLESRSGNILPVHTLLKRVLCREDFWNNRAQYEHVLWLLHHLRSSDRWVFAKQSCDEMYPIHVVLSQKCADDKEGLVAARALTRLLLEAHPESAAVWINGKSALHMAIENGWPCHDLLLALYPEALNRLDLHTELFPFQAAALKCAEATSCSPMAFDVTYELLRSNPANLIGMG